eukprot:TRINITY_DN23483_c0_g1_i6.p1 TRINITY_DN23483_c0_g1~~TRINITY_DN23483_c0_g1_i6.p1  ORF type:complete len:159 (+),score=52.21 TRINITY_DN23483_c0_g1_i6:76-552(+)
MCLFFFLMIRRPPRSTQGVSSAASDVYKRQEYMGTFFLEALEQIKHEHRKKLEQERREAGSNSTANRETREKQKYGDKVDLCELEWEDRERVLRLLFAKMNAGIPPALWRETLPAIDHKQADLEAFQEEYEAPEELKKYPAKRKPPSSGYEPWRRDDE